MALTRKRLNRTPLSSEGFPEPCVAPQMLPGLVMLTLLLDSDPFPPLRIIDRYCFISNRSITALLEKLFV